jgi:Bifunctional DNA primase/polymerase, N-terminal
MPACLLALRQAVQVNDHGGPGPLRRARRGRRERGVTGILGQALAYAEAAGWPVFPTRPDADLCPDPDDCPCKRPLTEHGFKDATTDPATIRQWWRRRPDANVAIVTGRPGPDVLDVDVKQAGSGFGALNRLKRAGLLTGASALVRTRSGGLHVYYAGTGQGCGALPRHHLDFKAAGGYVLAPPSRVHGRAYQLLDHRPGTAALDWQAVKRLLDPPRPTPPRTATWDGGELPPSVQRVLAADAADRSVALFRLVGACARAGLDGGTIHQLAAEYQPALEKYGGGDRLAAEVERCLRKIGAA